MIKSDETKKGGGENKFKINKRFKTMYAIDVRDSQTFLELCQKL